MQKSKLYGRLRPFIRSFKSHNKKRKLLNVANEIQAATGMTSIVDSVPEDVFFVGYPKSGNTWFRYLVTGAFYGVDPEYAPHALVNSLIPNMHTKQFYMRYQTPMFFKSHGLPDPAFKRVVYLLRDGRDVMVSYFHHLRNLNEKNVDFLNMVQSGDDLFYGQWHNHVEAWLSNPFNAQIITIRYEDMKKDAVHELQRFCQFVGIEREDSFLKSTVDKASFDKMRRKEKRDGWGHSMWKGNKQFIRRGQVGSYKDEMPPNVLEAFMQNASETLHKYGYLGEN